MVSFGFGVGIVHPRNHVTHGCGVVVSIPLFLCGMFFYPGIVFWVDFSGCFGVLCVLAFASIPLGLGWFWVVVFFIPPLSRFGVG